MAERDGRRPGGSKGGVGRQERLAAELRVNLKRRKDRERALEHGTKTREPASEQEKGERS